jgi:hypothetical protein
MFHIAQSACKIWTKTLINFDILGKSYKQSNTYTNFLKVDTMVSDNSDFRLVSLCALTSPEHRTQFVLVVWIFK